MRILSFLGGVGLLGGVLGGAEGGEKRPPAGPGRPARFDGRRFYNQVEDALPGIGAMVKWSLTRRPGFWNPYRELPPGPPPPPGAGPGKIRITFINHSTVLIQMEGLNLLTDPIFSMRAGPFESAGMKRVRPPGIRLEDLPPIHAVLISHNHYDHMDVPTLKRLIERDHPVIIAGLRNGRYLLPRGIGGVEELGWWQAVEPGAGLRVTFVPAQHFSMRRVYDRDAALWGGFVIEMDGTRVFYAGDTGFGPHLAEIRERFGALTVSIVPIGAFKPEWFMGPAHLSPRDAVRAHRILGARVSVPVHYGTFALGDDGETEAAEEFRRAGREAGIPEEELWVLGFGEGREIQIK